MISIVLVTGGCATGSGFTACRAKTDKERAAEKRAEVHESLAATYRLTNEEYHAHYHGELGKRARLEAAKESDFLVDLLFAAFGNCER